VKIFFENLDFQMSRFLFGGKKKKILIDIFLTLFYEVAENHNNEILKTKISNLLEKYFIYGKRYKIIFKFSVFS